MVDVLTHDQLGNTYISEVPRSKPRWRAVAARHARDLRLDRNVATGQTATDGPEVKRGRRQAGHKNTGPNAGGAGCVCAALVAVFDSTKKKVISNTNARPRYGWQ